MTPEGQAIFDSNVERIATQVAAGCRRGAALAVLGVGVELSVHELTLFASVICGRAHEMLLEQASKEEQEPDIDIPF